MITHGYKICSDLNLWDKLANFTDYPHLFSNDENIQKLIHGIKGSGQSIGWTLRQLDYISKNGYQKFKEGYEKGYIKNFYNKS